MNETVVYKKLKYNEFIENYCKNCEESCMGKPHPLSDICDVCIYENFEPTYFT